MSKNYLVMIILFGLASWAYAADGPFEFKLTPLMQDAPRAVFVASMGDYKTPAIFGHWETWNHEGEHNIPHDPEKITSGRRDIASAYYPAIGPYDMSDPNVAEYHCQLLKMAGVDGISFNLSFYDYDPWRQKSMRIYVPMLRRYGLKGIVRFENKFYSHVYSNPKEALAKSFGDMDSWLKVMGPIQYRVDGRPIFMMFTFMLTPEELRGWKDKYPEEQRPIVVTFGLKAGFVGIEDGIFGWTGDHFRLHDHPPYIRYVTPELARQNELYDRTLADKLLNRKQISFYVAGVSPGFDDIGCWGWGDGPRKVERDGGKVYEYRWEQTVKTNLPVVMIPTWNDWCEGTIIEPTMEFGDAYLAMTRKYVAEFKHTTEPRGNLMVPVWIYKVRKTATDPAALRDMNAASQAIVDGDFAKAEALTRPWARKLNADQLKFWDAARK